MVTGRPTSLKNRITGGQGHWRTSFCWRTGSLEDETLMEDRVTGRPDLAGGQDHWIAGLVCGQDFAGVHDCWKTGFCWSTGLQDLLTRKLNADIYLLCCCFACNQNANICVIHRQYFVATGTDFSGQQEFAGGQDHWIEADLHGEQGRTAGVCWSTQ